MTEEVFSEPIIRRFFPNLVLVRSLPSSFIHSFSSAKKRCNTSQGFCAFSDSHVITIDSCSLYLGVSLSFFLFNFYDNQFYLFPTRACWISNNYNHFIFTRLVAELPIISSPPSLYANLHVPTRIYDVEGGAIFFFDGATSTPRLRSPSPIMAPDKGQWSGLKCAWGLQDRKYGFYIST